MQNTIPLAALVFSFLRKPTTNFKSIIINTHRSQDIDFGCRFMAPTNNTLTTAGWEPSTTIGLMALVVAIPGALAALANCGHCYIIDVKRIKVDHRFVIFPARVLMRYSSKANPQYFREPTSQSPSRDVETQPRFR
jgi:hypothetical protein